jgi:hypothetical protein
VTLSSNETEYVALCEASTELVFLRQLLRAWHWISTEWTNCNIWR